ncbi:MAG: hypothetical protein J2P37_22860 [Ktedonobacteraceae bacterium]|nr:hypothetical protein [Ktedonobacteraceae bacterium]
MWRGRLRYFRDCKTALDQGDTVEHLQNFPYVSYHTAHVYANPETPGTYIYWQKKPGGTIIKQSISWEELLSSLEPDGIWEIM